MKKQDVSAIEIDRQMGKVLRSARIDAGLSQSKMGEHAGVTFQQVQKYEKGLNRISISRLFKLSQTLNVSPHTLVLRLQELMAHEVEEDESFYLERRKLIDSKRGQAALKSLAQIKNKALLNTVLALITELSAGVDKEMK